HEWAGVGYIGADDNFKEVLYTCYTNRIHPLAKDQLLNGHVSENTDINHHIALAEKLKENKTCTTIRHEISGFLMLFSKKLWNEIKFNESGKCLGVDNDFSSRVLKAGYEIAR